MTELVLGDIQPINLGSGVVSYHRNDYVRIVDVVSATIYDKVVVVHCNIDGALSRLTFPLAALVEHVAR